ncbi:MAG: glycerol-3-phosphate 1-O-acyltransferase PlsY [SAR324 cluster bacterium]|uniref:Glycerol-3-phosphate acyltransferase n=1 Tax=SAR324 cluster bacterium TaxID=2024889 RepID=A0A7X9FQI7_9DELT|nr:glycerol-3-phosphate 1-O-acyltransferase PlsY [SAR324 cluster bacterium]
MLDFWFSVLSLIPFYFIGAIPAGFLIAKSHGIDITAQGSGNVGATNVGRVLGIRAGIATLLIDLLKGIIAVLIARLIFNNSVFYGSAGAVVVCGHCFSIPGKLRGGKGVATSFGVLLIFNLWTALLALGVFILVFWRSRIVSLSSISAALSAPIFAILLGADDSIFYAISFIALLSVYRHNENLNRLLSGTEKQFSLAKKD